MPFFINKGLIGRHRSGMKINFEIRRIEKRFNALITNVGGSPSCEYSYLPLKFSGDLNAFEPSLSETSYPFSTSNLVADYSLLSDDSPAVKAARLLLEKVEELRPPRNGGSLFKKNFYDECLSSGIDLLQYFSDGELLEIFLKQLSMILENSGCVYSDGKVMYADLKKFHSAPGRILFESFWEYHDWKSIFPSMPDLAHLLQQEKYLFIETLLQYGSEQSIGQIAEEFFISAGVNINSRLMAVSFIDYSILSWLNRFSIVEFCGSGGMPLMKITSDGRSFLESLDSFR
jgi:hypothetical protein